MRYRLIDHHQSIITCTYLHDLYELTNQGTETIYGCVPNGELGISIILEGESYLQIGDTWVRQPQAAVYGLIKKKQFVKMSANYREINIGFLPHLFQLFIKESMSSLPESEATDLNFFFDKFQVEKLTAQLANSGNDTDILSHISEFLQNNVLLKKYDKRLYAAHDFIYHSNIYNVTELSESLNISTAGLRNIFRDKIGLSPKDVIKIARIKRALHNRDHDDQTLTHLAYDLNYFDQSHFIHEFQNTIGLSPKQYFKNKDLTFDFYNFARWRFSSFAENSSHT